MKWFFLIRSSLCALLIASSPAFGTVQFHEDLSLSGFGSGAAAITDQHVPVLLYRNVDDEICWDCDNTLGLQLDWNINAQWRSSIQVVKRPQDKLSSPSLERAFIEFRWQDWGIKAGRQRIPLFIMSEYLFVSQAFPWFRTPNDVYDGVLGISHYEGASIETQQWLTPDLPMRVALFAALPNQEQFAFYGQELEIDTDYELGLTAEIDLDENLLRTTIMQAKYRQTQPQQIVVFPEQETLTFVSLGGIYHWQGFQLISEALLSSEYHSNWYASLNYRIDKLTPYVTYSQRRKSVQNRSYLLGARYDLFPQLSLYAEWQYIKGQELLFSGHFTQIQLPPNDIVSDVNIYTLGLSFTF